MQTQYYMGYKYLVWQGNNLRWYWQVRDTGGHLDGKATSKAEAIREAKAAIGKHLWGRYPATIR